MSENRASLDSGRYSDRFAPYFDTDSSTWDIIGFLEHVKRRSKSFCYSAALDAWLKHLKRLRSGSGHNSTRASALLDNFHKRGPSSDKSRAKRAFNRPRYAPMYQTNVRSNYGQISYGNPEGADSARPTARPPAAGNPTGPNSESESECSNISYGYLSTIPDESKFLIPGSSRYIEDVLRNYGSRFRRLDLSHWGIIDTADTDLMEKLGGYSWDIMESYPPPPTFPTYLSTHIKSYRGVEDVSGCIVRAYESESTVSSSPPDERYLKHWVDHCCHHVINLLTATHGWLAQPLGEGAWEGVYWNLLDSCFLNLRDLGVQRRDIHLHSLQDEDEPVVGVNHRFDGIVRTRQTLPPANRWLELAVIEVSKAFQNESSTKWNSDMTKLSIGCRSILNQLKAVVDNNAEVIPKLAAVGILQAGNRTMVIIMRCVGNNVFVLKRGHAWTLPSSMSDFSSIENVMAVIWIAREYIRMTYEAVSDYCSRARPSGVGPSPRKTTDPGFL